MNKPKLRIAILGLEDATTGGAYIAENLMIDQIHKSCHNADIIVFDNFTKRNSIQRVTNRIFRKSQMLLALFTYSPAFWRMNSHFLSKQSSYLERKLQKINIDLVIFVGPYEEALLLRKIPYLVTIWDLGHREFTHLPEMSSARTFEWREWLINNLAKKAVGILVDSESTKLKLSTEYAILESSILVLPFAPQGKIGLDSSTRDDFAFYPAHFWSHKNHVILIKSIKHLVNIGGSPRQLVLTGLDKGSKEHVYRLAKELNVLEFLDYRGFVSYSEIQSLYSKAAITVMPSILGPTNLPPLESLLHGCPVAVTKEGSWNLTKHKGVIILDAFDIAAWSQILDKSYGLPIVEISDIESDLNHRHECNVKTLEEFFYKFELMQGLYK